MVYPAKDRTARQETLPQELQARYRPYPYEVQETPWEAFKGKPKPWKIGLDHLPGRLAVARGRDRARSVSSSTRRRRRASSRARCRSTSSRATRRRRPSSRSPRSSRWCATASTASCCCRSPGRRSRRRSTRPERPACPSSSSTTSFANAKYAVNVWSQNNSPAAAGVAGLVKKGNVLFVRGIAGNPVEQAFQDAAVADIKACPGLKIVGTIYGKWTNATAKAETVKWLAVAPGHEDRRRDPERHHDGRHRSGVPAGRPGCRRSAAAAVRVASCPGG